jgi:hypothetical protein
MTRVPAIFITQKSELPALYSVEFQYAFYLKSLYNERKKLHF